MGAFASWRSFSYGGILPLHKNLPRPIINTSLPSLKAISHRNTPLFWPKYRGPPTYPLHPIKTNNARALRLTAAAGTELAGASSRACVVFLIPRIALYRKLCAFIMHVFSLGQAVAHCPRFFTAAPRRSSGLVSVPMWLIYLPNQLRIIG